MPQRFKLLVFDWDGTLMDSAAVIVASLQAACSELKLPVPCDDKARYVIGLGLHDAMLHILPDLDPAVYPALVERYRHHYFLRDSSTVLFAGVAEALQDLHASGFQLAVATGKSRHGLDRALKATGVACYFHATRCADEGSSKPHPGMLEYLMRVLDADHTATLMIGDTTHDMEMAKNASVARLAVAYGAHCREELLHYAPLACLDAFSELRAWLRQHA
jgi:phosphoglycolate phosphatase